MKWNKAKEYSAGYLAHKTSITINYYQPVLGSIQCFLWAFQNPPANMSLLILLSCACTYFSASGKLPTRDFGLFPQLLQVLSLSLSPLCLPCQKSESWSATSLSDSNLFPSALQPKRKPVLKLKTGTFWFLQRGDLHHVFCSQSRTSFSFAILFFSWLRVTFNKLVLIFL